MKRFTLSLAIVLMSLTAAYSTHIQGGGITYQCLGGNQYAVTLKIYYDCGTYPITTNLNTLGITITNNCGFPQQTLTLTKVVAQTNVQVSQLCAQQLPNSECSGGNQPGVWMATFTGTITLPGACNSWHFWYQTCCWNTNTNTPGQQSQLFHTTLNNTAAAGGCDSSPVMGPDPIPYMCVNQPNTYSLGATDPNGNNIVYSLNPAQNGSPGTPTVLNYNGGYTGTTPIPGMIINPTTGLITVTPNTLGNFIVQVNCTTYNAAGVLIGIVQQQLQIVVINCNNAVPSPPAGGVSGLTGNVTSTAFNNVTFCVGLPGCFNVVFTDANAANIITLTSTVTSALPGSTFVITGTNPVTGTVCWTPTATSPVNSNVTFTGEDNACPITGQNFFNVDVDVVNTCCTPPVMTSTAVCTGASNGTVTATPNGASPWDYIWINTANGTQVSSVNNIAGPHTVNNLPAGTYQVTVTDNNGCAQTANVTITSNPIPTAPIVQSWNCPAQNSVALTCNPNPAGGTFLWSPGGQTTAAINVNPATTTTYTVVYTLNGCSATSTSTVIPLPTVTTSVSNPLCNGACTGIATATPALGQAPFTYNWTGGATTQAANNLCAGTYTVTISDAHGCTATANATITQPSAITATLASTNPSCNGTCNGSVTVTAGGGTSPLQYSMNGGPFQTSNTFTGLCSGIKTIIVRDANNCTQTLTVTLTQPAALTLTQTNANVSTCGNSNGTITVNANGGNNPYQYSINGGPNQNNPSFTQLAAGTHTITVTDNNGCTASVQVNLGTAPAPVASVGSQTNLSCFGGSNGSALINVTGGTAPMSYNLNPGPTQPSNVFNGLTAGAYTVIITDANGCNSSTSFTITAPTQLTYTTTPTPTTCNGTCNGEILFTAAGATPPYQYSVNNGLTFSSPNPQTGLCAGNINVVVRDANGCLANSVVVINQPAAITSTFTNVNPLCHNACNGQITVNASGGNTPYQFSVNNGALQSSNIFTGLCSGNNVIHIEDVNGCFINSTQVLANPPAFTINVVSNTSSNCGFNDGAFQVAATGGNAPYVYSSNGSPNQSSGTFANIVGGAYTVIATDNLGCQQQIFVGVNDIQMSAALVSSTNVTCFGGNDGAATVVNTGGGAPITYELDNSGITQPTGTFTGLNAGTHLITVYDNGFCVASVSVTITQPPLITFATTNTNINCFGASTGQIIFNNAAGGVGGYQYSVNGALGPFQNSPAFSGLAAGTYNLAVSDANGCIVTSTATLTQGTPVAYVANINNLTCFNNSSGFLQLVGSGGQSPYQHSINNGATFSAGFTFSGLSAGTYNVIVADALGCQVTGTHVISQPTALTAGYVVSATLCNGSCDGTVQVNATGGTPPYLYSSNNGTTYQTASLLGNLCAGSHQVLMHDQNNCLIGSTHNITQPAPVTFTQVTTPATCNISNGVIAITANGGTPGYTYSINNGNTFQANNQFTGLTSGPYPIVVQDQNNCTSTNTVTILDQGPPVITGVTVNNVTCNGACNGSLTVNAMGGTGALQYHIGGVPQASNLFTGLCPVTCTATVTDANGCVDTQPATITEPAALTFTSAQTPLQCFNNYTGAASITANGGTTPYLYSYDNGTSFTTLPSTNGLAAGTYNLVVKDANACQATGQVVVTQPAQLVISSQNSNGPLCFGGCNGNVSVTVTGGTVAGLYTYLWSGGVAGTNQNTAINLCAGSYAVVAQDDNGCWANANFTLVNPPQYQITAATATDVLCTGNCNGTININAAGATQYSIDAGQTYSGANSYNNLCPGVYNVNALNANNCLASTVVFINEPTPVVLQATADMIYCAGTTMVAAGYASGGNGPYNYQWNNGANTATQNVTPNGTQIFSVYATDVNGCVSNTDSTVYTPFPTFTTALTASANITCPGDQVTLTTSVNGGNPSYDYLWSTGAITSDIIITNNAAATYSVIISDQCLVTDTLSVSINTFAVPQVSFTASTPEGCTPLTVTLTNTTPAGQVGGNCVWTFSDGTMLNGCGSISPIFETPGCYNVNLAVTSPDGCVGNLSQNNLFCVNPNPVANFYWSPANPDLLHPEVQFHNWSTNAETFSWDIAGQMSSTDSDPYFSFHNMDTGYYQVCLAVTNEFGCIDDTCKMIHLGDITTMYIPNSFTPNADGVNDLFNPVFSGAISDGYEFMVFDRWGNMIFMSQSLQGAWDGTYRSMQCKEDVYVWKLKIRDENGDRKEFYGHVSLLR